MASNSEFGSEYSYVLFKVYISFLEFCSSIKFYSSGYNYEDLIDWRNWFFRKLYK